MLRADALLQGFFPTQGLKLISLVSSALKDVFTTTLTWEATSVGGRERQDREEGGEKRREGKRRDKERARVEVLRQLRVLKERCVRRLCWTAICSVRVSARFLPLLQHLFPPSIDQHLDSQRLSPLSVFS